MLTNKIKLNDTLKTGNVRVVSHLSGQWHRRKAMDHAISVTFW